MIPNFNPDMPLAHILQQTPKGALFFHNRGHLGSYQILERAMPEFKAAGVRHFYVQLPEKLFKDALKQHFTSGSNLDRVFSVIDNKDQKEHLKALVIAAHKVGIEVLAVDTNEALIPNTHLAGDAKMAETIIKQRLAHDPNIVDLMKAHMLQLQGEKYIGLFGGNHIPIGKSFEACLVILQSRSLEQGRSHLHVLPEHISADPQSAAIINQCHFMTFIPQSCDESVDFSQPVESKNLDNLNKLLAALSLPQCKAYRHTNSQKISAAAFVENPDIWANIVTLMDPFAKRLDTSYNPVLVAIIFDDIDQDSVCEKIIASLAKIKEIR